MPRDVARASLYSGQINLWVEDQLTRAYLSALWNDAAVKFLIGGGSEGAKAILKDAEDAGYTNVFAVADRDFRLSNFTDWLVPNRPFRRFILPRHEIENYLLDTAALHGCRFNTRGTTAIEIDAILDAEASRRCWWAACRDVVYQIRELFFDQFIEHPKTPPVESETAAGEHIVSSPWFRALPVNAGGMTEAEVYRRLTVAHARAQQLLIDGGWRIEFSGKEFLRLIGGRIFNRAKAPGSYRPKPAEFDADLAKEIAAWQVANGTIPDDLRVLLAALKARIAPVEREGPRGARLLRDDPVLSGREF